MSRIISFDRKYRKLVPYQRSSTASTTDFIFDTAITSFGFFNDEANGENTFDVSTYLVPPSGNKLVYYNADTDVRTSVQISSISTGLPVDIINNRTVTTVLPISAGIDANQLMMTTSVQSATNIAKLAYIQTVVNPNQYYVVPYGAENDASFNFANGDSVVYTRASDSSTGSVSIVGNFIDTDTQTIVIYPSADLDVGDYISLTQPTRKISLGFLRR